jgi:hypothetical protein
MCILFFLIITIVYSCTSTSREKKEKIKPKNFHCFTKEFKINKKNELKIFVCENEKLQYWENIIESKVIYSKDTINVLKEYQLHFNSKAENLHFVDFINDGNKFTAIYFYSGCAGDLCMVVLKVEFTINKKVILF